MTQKVFIFDSPDGTGKTEISRELSRRTAVPYFKMTTEHENWRKGTFIEALRFDQTYIAEFLFQTCYSAIIDRAYPAEFVYSKVFGRKTDMQVLTNVDRRFSQMGAVIVIPLRSNYSNSRDDEIIPKDKLEDLHNGYIEFAEWTQCNVIKLYVDSYHNRLSEEINAIYDGLAMIDRGEKNVCMIGENK